MKKFLSRKFILSLAAFIGSIGFAISGLNSNNEKVILIGIGATILSQAIYAACEAYVDGKKAPPMEG